MNFDVGTQYTRAHILDILGVPEGRRGGDWATGYTRFTDELYVFCNVGSAGRTGHDYPNRWDGKQLIWSAKKPLKRVSAPDARGRRGISASTYLPSIYRSIAPHMPAARQRQIFKIPHL